MGEQGGQVWGEPHRHCLGWTPGHWTKVTLVPGSGQPPTLQKGGGGSHEWGPSPPSQSPCTQASELRGLSFLAQSALLPLSSLFLAGLLSSASPCPHVCPQPAGASLRLVPSPVSVFPSPWLMSFEVPCSIALLRHNPPLSIFHHQSHQS